MPLPLNRFFLAILTPARPRKPATAFLIWLPAVQSWWRTFAKFQDFGSTLRVLLTTPTWTLWSHALPVYSVCEVPWLYITGYLTSFQPLLNVLHATHGLTNLSGTSEWQWIRTNQRISTLKNIFPISNIPALSRSYQRGSGSIKQKFSPQLCHRSSEYGCNFPLMNHLSCNFQPSILYRQNLHHRSCSWIKFGKITKLRVQLFSESGTCVEASQKSKQNWKLLTSNIPPILLRHLVHWSIESSSILINWYTIGWRITTTKPMRGTRCV